MSQKVTVDRYANKRFGRLVATNRYESDGRRVTIWCKCDCGNSARVRLDHLRSGTTVSCGCYGREKRYWPKNTHHLSGSRIHNIWTGMKERCYNQNHKAYRGYGGRGITVCDAWRDDFMCFYDWAVSAGYRSDLTLDRIDNDGHYCPSNCRWATLSEQGRNKRIPGDHISGVRGVTKDKRYDKWKAIIGLNGKSIWLGYFDDVDAAITARQNAERRYWGRESNG